MSSIGQALFKSELIEDDSYFWNVSRYIHLNPVRGKRPLLEHPRDWPWSSYPGYAQKSQQLDWIAYDQDWRAWQGEIGGKDPARAYRRFVEAGLEDPPTNPLKAAWEGWVLGSEAFLKKIKRQIVAPHHDDEVPAAKRLATLDAVEVISLFLQWQLTTSSRLKITRVGAAARPGAIWPIAVQLRHSDRWRLCLD